MSGGVVRLGDKNICGGAVLAGEPSVRINGLPVAVNGAPVSAHTNFKPPHTNAQTSATTNKTVRAGGKLIVTATDLDTCHHVRGTGSLNVRIGS
jgi:uncharacterized Zn-binding protein involved in type VI secretion